MDADSGTGYRYIPAREALADGYYRLNVAESVQPDVIEQIVREGMETFRRLSEPAPKGGSTEKPKNADDAEHRIVRMPSR